ncbi:hypothetical protein [Pseudomonas sp. UBA1879]|uniref:hypothetical protein n=1 Tax=Pseudomonas sp. UBA1879 TaxID=1947305 RepID=UPI0025F882C8|nr:hypothetical protein [Pseudomonas sp. UBA1879]
MAKISATTTIKRAWWVIPYITLAIWLWRVLDQRPEPKTIERTVRRGIQVDVD